MSVAYVDSSVVIALIFGEQTTVSARRLQAFDQLVSSNLLEAEVRAACVREKVDFTEDAVAGISWIVPDRPLSEEIARILDHGYVRGADCWHLASAMYLAPDASELAFVTLDKTQAMAARTLGFSTT